MSSETLTTQKNTSRKLLRFSLIVFVVTWAMYILKHIFFGSHQLGDPDRYKESFAFFNKNGFYEASVHGTSLLYNSVIWVFYKLFNNVDAAIITVNILSELIVLFVGLQLLKKIKGTVDRIYFYAIAATYIFITLNIHSYVRTANDTFLAVFIAIIFYILFAKLPTTQKTNLYYIYIGLLLGICTAIRPTSLFLFVIVAVFFGIKFLFQSLQFKNLLSAGFIIGVSCATIISLIHYPSLKEKGTLSFYNKNFEKDVNWIQRNYLGLKKIQEGKEPLHKSAIFNKTPFSEVRTYVQENGEDSLPNSSLKFVQKDPKLYAQVVAYNVVYSVAKFIRYYGCMLVFPLLIFFQKPWFGSQKIAFWLFITYTLLICMLCFTMMEYRWYIGYEILLLMAILASIPLLRKKFKNTVLDVLFTISLLFVAICNIAQTFFISSTY